MSKKGHEASDTPRRDVAWDAPATRSMPIFTHDVTCAYCQRHFTAELFSPIPPVYCSKVDNPDCYKQRTAAYMREYRARQRGETDEE